MCNMIKNHVTVFVVANKDKVQVVSKKINNSFILRAVMGEAILAEVSITRIGDIATLKGVIDIFEKKVPAKIIKKLSKEGARLATLWNWKQKTSGVQSPVSESKVKRIISQLDLEIVDDQVRDKRTGNKLGEIKEIEQIEDSRFFSPNPGCYWLRQANSWRIIPGLFGAWTRVRGTSETRRCNSSGGMSSRRRVADYIRVSVWNQVGAYASRSRRNASFVDAEDWEYVWLWEVEAGGARTDSDHYSRWDGSRIHCSL